MESTFSDAITAAVVGIDTFAATLSPHSEWARRSVASPRAYVEDHQSLAAEVGALRAIETDHGDANVAEDLAELPTLERPLELILAEETLDDAALFELKRFLFHGRAVLQRVEGAVGLEPGWTSTLTHLLQTLHPDGTDSPRFRLASALDARLAGVRKAAKTAKAAARHLRTTLEANVVEEHGGRFDIRGRYVPDDDVDLGALAASPLLRATASGFEMIADSLDDAARDAERAADEVAAVERDVRLRLTQAFAKHTDELIAIREALGVLDVRLAKVALRQTLGGCWGTPSDRLAIIAGRHPRLADDAQPIDVTLPADRATVVTGPNMGGKSVLLELIGLCQWAAQHAFPVPAERFEYLAVERVAYVGAEEASRSAAAGLSAFGREVRRLVELLDQHRHTLWLFDEFGRGTHPDEGATLAAELHADRVADGDLVVSATHFPAVAADPEAFHLRIAGLLGVEELESLDRPADLEEIESALRRAMDYQPVPVVPDGSAVPRDARRIARALGLDFDRD